MKCKKCGKDFEPKKGLKNYCSLSCRNSHNTSTEEVKTKIVQCIGCGNDVEVNKRTNPKIVKCEQCKQLTNNSRLIRHESKI